MKHLTIEATEPEADEILEAISALGVAVEVIEIENHADDACQMVFEFYEY